MFPSMFQVGTSDFISVVLLTLGPALIIALLLGIQRLRGKPGVNGLRCARFAALLPIPIQSLLAVALVVLSRSPFETWLLLAFSGTGLCAACSLWAFTAFICGEARSSPTRTSKPPFQYRFSTAIVAMLCGSILLYFVVQAFKSSILAGMAALLAAVLGFTLIVVATERVVRRRERRHE